MVYTLHVPSHARIHTHTTLFTPQRIIDDWIFLGFLVGNDFLPHSATLDIAEGGLNTLYDIYKEVCEGVRVRVCLYECVWGCACACVFV
jgi:5'-3' exonuclease